uniref:Uncharacterized protein n=1 Tax=Arundo donax TaxID=35708 RepID=A0A0A9CDD5_ARUDO
MPLVYTRELSDGSGPCGGVCRTGWYIGTCGGGSTAPEATDMGGGGACVVTCRGASGRCACSLAGGGGGWSTTTTFTSLSSGSGAGAVPLARASSCRGGAALSAAPMTRLPAAGVPAES